MLTEEMSETFVLWLWEKYKALTRGTDGKQECEIANLRYKVDEQAKRLESEKQKYTKTIEIAMGNLHTAENERRKFTELYESTIKKLEALREQKKGDSEDFSKALSDKDNVIVQLRTRLTEAEQRAKSITENNRLINEQLKKVSEQIAEKDKEITGTRISMARLREKIEFAELSGIVYPNACEMSVRLKELRAGAKESAKVETPTKKAGKKEQAKAKVEQQTEEKDDTPKLAVPKGTTPVPFKRDEDGVFRTQCTRGGLKPNNKPCNVGSGICRRCIHFHSVDDEHMTVFCTNQ